MSLNIKTTNNSEEVADFVASSILNQLNSNKRVLFFVTGGSSIMVGVRVAELLQNYPHHNLTVMLTDERYGSVGHRDSNWQQLLDKGFILPQAKLIPVLFGDDKKNTVEKFDQNLVKEFEKAEYKIGLFGVGADGHTAGILPESEAILSLHLACGYDTPTFSRITITPKGIEKLNEAVVWMQGEKKWSVLENLNKNIPARPNDEGASLLTKGWQAGGDIIKQPAQIFKKVPLLTIFTDYPGSRA